MSWRCDGVILNCHVFQLYYREPRTVVDRKKLESLYNRYKDPSEPEKIGMEGVVRFLEDLSLDPTSRFATEILVTRKNFDIFVLGPFS